MKSLKAVVRMTPSRLGRGKPASCASQERATYHKIYYSFAAVKPGSKQAPCADRVSWVGGNLAGHGVIVRKADLMAAAMDCGHKHLSGRRTRHVILSCEPCAEEERADAERRLIESAPLLAALLSAKRWIAIIHRDTDKPHMHMLIANFDPKNDRRLEFSPKFLSEIQEMMWTPFLDSGKGSRMGGHSVRGKAILAWKKEDPARRNRALEEVYDHMEKHNKLGLGRNDLALWLASQCAGQGWDGSGLLKEDGSPRKKPVLQVDGIDLRLIFLMRFVRGRRSVTPKKSPKPPVKTRPSRRPAQPDSHSGPV